MAGWLGPLIQAGGAIVGGLLGQDSARDAARLNARAQKQFAQHGIRWRVEDAKAAGLHPLYALGAQTPSFSPVHVQSPMGDALAEAGQHVGRAVSATMTGQEKLMQMYQLENARAQYQETDARRQLIEEELAALRRNAQPDMPAVNSSSSIPPGAFITKPSEVTSHDPSNTGIAAGPPDVAFKRWDIGGGHYVLLPNASSISEALESILENDKAMALFMQYNRAEGDPASLQYFQDKFILGKSDREIADERARAWRHSQYVKKRLKPMRKNEYFFYK